MVVRDLAENPPPHAGGAFVSALQTPPDRLTKEQSEATALSESLIAELSAADVLVLGVPMHNFGLPSTLKAWIDHVVRAGRTFSFSAHGPQGLLKGKRAVLVLSRGGVYSDGPAKPYDFQEPSFERFLDLSVSLTLKLFTLKASPIARLDRKRRLRRQPHNQNRFSRISPDLTER